MDDLIRRQAALEKVRTMQTYKLFMGDDMILIDKAEVQTELMMLPPAQPEPKTGKWIGTEFDGYADGNPVFYEWQCSECGCIFEDEEPTYKFYPNCGARMEGAAT